MAQQEEKKEENQESAKTDFTGAWVLKTNENMDEFLKSQGVSWALRKMAAAASMTINIEQTATHLKVKTKLPIGEVDQEIPMDGSILETKSPRKEDVKISLEWKDEKTLAIAVENLTKKTKTYIERCMPDKDTMKDIVKNDKGVQMIRIFNRKK